MGIRHDLGFVHVHPKDHLLGNSIKVFEHRAKVLQRSERDRLEDLALEGWQSRLGNGRAGRRTVTAISPVLREWVRRTHGRLTYRATQILSGHGCFGAFLCQIGREESASCHHCSCDEDTAQHTLGTCPAWARERGVLVAAVGHDLTLRAVVAQMVECKEKWQAVLTFCETVVSQKEAAEREREASADAPTIRRRLTGRRRRQYNLLMPLLDGPRPTDSGELAGR
ncbi:hypothetical protein ABMA27_016806 [Loxostege sticticalis]|uniref:Reverse transcriptase n=1 Tax=Loxostege sticticalis TaxID=481309 RepID=A0ABR3I3M7_LOXSC